MAMNEYERQAHLFLVKHALRVQVIRPGVVGGKPKPPPWGDGKPVARGHGAENIAHGYHYVVIIAGAGRCIHFDFWGSIAKRTDYEVFEKKIEPPSSCDILACISSDAYIPGSVAEYFDEYGQPEGDVVKAFKQAERAIEHGAMLRDFFTEDELEDLQEIQ